MEEGPGCLIFRPAGIPDLAAALPEDIERPSSVSGERPIGPVDSPQGALALHPGASKSHRLPSAMVPRRGSPRGRLAAGGK
eukprot:11975761-Alexandrium_andersonii.AAC.1